MTVHGQRFTTYDGSHVGCNIPLTNGGYVHCSRKADNLLETPPRLIQYKAFHPMQCNCNIHAGICVNDPHGEDFTSPSHLPCTRCQVYADTRIINNLSSYEAPWYLAVVQSCFFLSCSDHLSPGSLPVFMLSFSRGSVAS